MSDEFAGFKEVPRTDEFAGFSTPAPTAQQKAVVTANDNSESAAKALTVGKKINVPATVVESDLPSYEAHARTQSAVKASANPYIAKYIDGNPMASKVSADDYEKLDEVSLYLQSLKPEKINGTSWVQSLTNVPEIASLLGTEPGRARLISAAKELPFKLFEGLKDFATTPGRVMSGELDLSTPEGMDQAISFGLGAALGMKGVARPKGGITVEPTGTSTEEFLATLRGMKTRQEIDDFIRSKTDEPTLALARASAASDALTKTVEVAQDSKTKQRSPETFSEFTAAHGEEALHIPADKILELYTKAGKVPAEGDGLFGFVKGLEGKILAGSATGGEVTIPLGQYIAHVDPAVHEGLKDSIRLHDDGATVEEAKAGIEAWHGSPHEFEAFSNEKIGTGEGAQSYGYGHYFAENKVVAASYQNSFDATVEGRPFDVNNPLHKAASLLDQFGSRRAALEEVKSSEDVYNDDFGRAVRDILESKPIPKIETKANLYRVLIRAEKEQFLDWDKPLNQQTDKIIQALAEASVKELSGTVEEQARLLKESPTPLGEWLDAAGGGPHGYIWNKSREMSAALYKAGIPGIKYLDQGSRAEGKGSSNYVVFDPSIIKITHRNDAAVANTIEAKAAAEKRSLYLNQLFTEAKAVGITEAEFKSYSAKIERAEQAVLDKAVAIAKRDVAKRLTPEWKAHEAAIRAEVISDLNTVGPFAVEKYIKDNKISLTPEIADEFAPLFGYDVGADLRADLIDLEDARVSRKLGPKVQFNEAVKAETAARLEERHGNLAETIAEEARSLALADHTFDILADEVKYLARAAKVEPPLSKDQMVSWATDVFERSSVGEARNWEKHRRAVEKNGREAEKALLKGDFVEAFDAKQRQMLAAIVAKESFKFQQTLATAEKLFELATDNQSIASVDQTHLDQLREMLASIGVEQKYMPFERPVPLSDFVAASDGQLAVAPWLYETNPPKLVDMSVTQFRDFVKSAQSMMHVGREVKTVENLHGKAKLQDVIFDSTKELDRFNLINQPLNPSILQRAASVGRYVTGAHLLVERMFDYTDRFDPHGPITSYLDRPLRDSNVKELVLWEQVSKMLRDLRPLTDTSVNEFIKNAVLPDGLDKTGFLSMRRSNLRQLMLNMGNESNIKKVVEGFSVPETQVWDLINRHATKQDWQWVQGVWDIFAHLKPEADAMQARDTGVPVDTVEARAISNAHGDFAGGYYPVVYDKARSNIQGHVAAQGSLFDSHYVQATTPHAYTQARTQFAAPLDLSGAFLPSRLQGMIHDIAFREAVRNANKLISNTEFRAEIAKKWGKEYADLLIPWLKDIANAHNLDDAYAQGIARGMSLIRQNVVSTLVGFNLGTFIKHGFTALGMSAARVGGLELTKAAAEIGPIAYARSAKDLLIRNERTPDQAFIDAFRDTIDQGPRGDDVRKFILDSSAVMRNRQRKYEDSIRGAYESMNSAGVMKVLADARQNAMNLGRFAVAFSDGFSAMPTWYAAYKQAFAKGEGHADAVFIADKEVSRAHGSNFVGDQPMVTRLPNTVTGEAMRWFTSMYRFWNHTVNNNFQLAWDIAARIRGSKALQAPPPGSILNFVEKNGEWSHTPEPGANALSITKAVGLILATILIEEMSGPTLDEDQHDYTRRAFDATLRYFGGGFVVSREATNALAGGHEPSVGLFGTVMKAAWQTGDDIARSTSAKAAVSKDWLIHTFTALGMLTGAGGTSLGKAVSFEKDILTGREKPLMWGVGDQDYLPFNQYRQGFRTGHSKPRIHK